MRRAASIIPHPLRQRLRALRAPRAAKPADTPPGWQVAPPDFIGVGVQKAGTSWWFAMLRDHPRFHRPAGLPKEAHFFDRFWAEPFDDSAILEYHRLFARPPGRVTGEWSPEYILDFWTPPLMAQAAPDARVLVLVRDPVERFLSGLTQVSRSGAPLRRGTASNAFQRGFYAAQLRRLFQSVDPARVLTLQYERCTRDPRAEFGRTLEFLQWEPWEAGDARFQRRVNPTDNRKLVLPDGVRQRLVELYRSDVLDLLTLLPDLDITLWPNFAGLARRSGAFASEQLPVVQSVSRS